MVAITPTVCAQNVHFLAGMVRHAHVEARMVRHAHMEARMVRHAHVEARRVRHAHVEARRTVPGAWSACVCTISCVYYTCTYLHVYTHAIRQQGYVTRL